MCLVQKLEFLLLVLAAQLDELRSSAERKEEVDAHRDDELAFGVVRTFQRQPSSRTAPCSAEGWYSGRRGIVRRHIFVVVAVGAAAEIADVHAGGKSEAWAVL